MFLSSEYEQLWGKTQLSPPCRHRADPNAFHGCVPGKYALAEFGKDSYTTFL